MSAQHPSSVGSNIFDAEGIVTLPDSLGNPVVCVGTEAWLYPVRASILYSNQSLELNMAEHGRTWKALQRSHRTSQTMRS